MRHKSYRLCGLTFELTGAQRRGTPLRVRFSAPGFGVAFEGVALEGVNLVADEAGDGHRVHSWTDGLECNCAADDAWDASVEAEVC